MLIAQPTNHNPQPTTHNPQPTSHNPQATMMPYSNLIAALKSECAKINLIYSTFGDGRITSALKEKEYLDHLEAGLKTNYPSIVVSRPAERFWYDIRINNLPINLKLTTGGTDNAFNKVAILYTISGTDVQKRNMNYNEFFKAIKAAHKKTVRDHSTEYHYLVVNKTSGNILLKSILDIHSYKSNPCNDLQINWANEFTHIDHVTPDPLYKEKITTLLRTVQTSIRQAIAGMRDFADATISEEDL